MGQKVRFQREIDPSELGVEFLRIEDGLYYVRNTVTKDVMVLSKAQAEAFGIIL